MGERADEGLRSEVLREVEGRHHVRLEGLVRTAGGVRYERSELRGGCLVWLFLGVAVPILVWVYPGGLWGKGGINGVIGVGMAVGWLALVGDVTRKVIVTAEPGRLWVERRMFGMRWRREVRLDGDGLAVYVMKQSGMMTAYGVRAAHGGRTLGVALDRREAEALARVLEEAVWPGGRGRPAETPGLEV